MKKIWIVIATLFLAAALLVGCAGSPANQVTSTNGQGANTGASPNFRLLISDEVNDIADFVSLNATITGFGYLPAGESSEWQEIKFPEDGYPTVNLVQLPNLNATEIWNGYLTSGNYTKVFIYVDEVTGVLDGDGEINVKLPGGKFQISKPFEVPEGGMVNYVFDITAVKAGNSGKYILRPQVADSGTDVDFVEVTGKGKPEGIGKPEGAGKPDGVGKPEDTGNPESEIEVDEEG